MPRKLPDIKLVVYKNLRIISEQLIPANRISSGNLDRLLRVMYARHAENSDDELATFFINRRKGAPAQHQKYDCKTTLDKKHKTINRSCGDKSCIAIAITPISAETLEAIELIQRQNRRS